MSHRVFATLLVKDELDVLPYTLAHLYAQELDGIIVADNGSVDGTREYLASEAVANRITLLYDDEPAWYQQAKMTELARIAHEAGATWIIPHDADEWWRVSDGRTLGSYLRSRNEPVIGAPIFNYFASERDNIAEANPYRRLTWRNPPVTLVKVAFQYNPNTKLADGNHLLLLPDNSPVRTNIAELEMRHLCHRSEDHFVSAVKNVGAALAATNYPEERGGHGRVYWKHYLATGEEGLRAWWREHFYLREPESTGFIYDPIPMD